MPKEITFYVILGKKRDPSEICANPNLRNQTNITKKPSYVYVFHLYAQQRNHSLSIDDRQIQNGAQKSPPPPLPNHTL